MQLAKISIKKTTVPIVLFTILVLVGLFFGNKLKYDLMPDISTPMVSVLTVYPGAGPQEVETSVSIPLEDVLTSIENLEELTTKSYENLSIIQLSLNDKADIDAVVAEVQMKVNQKLKDLPEDVLIPSISKFDLNNLPVMKIGATSNLSDKEMYDLMDKEVKSVLARISGVAEININGAMEREIKVNIDPVKLEAFNLSLFQVKQAISVSNIEYPAGKVRNASREITVRLAGKFSSLDDLRNIVVGATREGSYIRLSDIADIYDGLKDVENIIRINGLEAIGVDIVKQRDANAVELSENVREAIAQIEKDYSDINLKFEIADDQSEFTLEAANSVMVDLVLAILLVSAIMLVFLNSVRNSIFVLISIPTSLVSTFTAMYLFDFTLDLISLTSLSLVVGSLVDDAIVVIENIYRHMEMGKNRVQASYDGVKELGLTVTAITLVLVAVFLPITFLSGIVGDILREYAVTIVVSMLLSLLVSFTLVPLMTSRFAKLENEKKGLLGKALKLFDLGIEKLNKGVLGSVKWALNHKIVTLAGVIMLFISSVWLVSAGFIGTEFASAGDRGNFILRLEFAKDITLEENNRITREVEDILFGQPEIDMVYTTVGKKSGMVSTQTTPYYTEFNIKLVPHDQRDVASDVFARLLRVQLEETIPGPLFKAVNINLMGSEDLPIGYTIIGNNMDDVHAYSKEVIKILKSIEGTSEVESTYEEGSPEYRIEINRDKMTKLGLSMAEVGGTLQMSFAGNTSNKYSDGKKEYDINIRLDEFNRRQKSDIENLVFLNSKGQYIYLKQFADVIEGSGPTMLMRYDRNAAIQVKSQLIGVSQGTVQSQFDEMIKEIDDKNISITQPKSARMMAESFADLGVAFLAAIIFVYLIMVVLYNSWVYPFVVLFSIPMALSGALYALALTNNNLSIFSILGIIMLVGLVAKNAILVVDFTNELKEKGMQVRESLMEAVKLRFRPILMTNISMIIGLLPLALSQGAGSEWKTGIGWTLIGGLFISMFLSMIIVPVVYYIMDRLIEKFKKEKQFDAIIKAL